MIGRVLRVLVGFAAACVAAAAAMVLFVFTPSELIGLPPDVATDRIPKLIELTGFVAVQAALFAMPFALVAVVIGEWRQSRSCSYYAVAGLLIALLGFLAQHSTEQAGQPTIVNYYALTAFLAAGLFGGLFYWLFSGRLAGRRAIDTRPAPGIEPGSGPESAPGAAKLPAATPKTDKIEANPDASATLAAANGKN